MRSKRDNLALWIHRLGLMGTLQKVFSSSLIVINYHRIRPNIQNGSNRFDDEVFGPTAAELEQQFRWLKQNTDVLSEEDLIGISLGKYNPPKRASLITFDDGYRDNYTLAYPLLRAVGLPAIFFVPTQGMEDRALGWWDIIAYLLKSTKHEYVPFEGEEICTRSNLQQSIRFVLSLIDKNYKDIDELLEELSAACEVRLPNREVQENELMTWEILKEVSENGVSIGSHTHSHSILSYMDLQSQKNELTRSKKIIEERIGKRVHSLSYPVGNLKHFSEDTKRIAEESGYHLAFSFLTGSNTWNTLDPMDVKRIAVSRYFPRFVGTLSIPSLFCN